MLFKLRNYLNHNLFYSWEREIDAHEKFEETETYKRIK